MVLSRGKTRRHRTSEPKKGVATIPQLRRLFEGIEQFVDSRIAKRESKESLSKELRTEWKRVFMKELDKKEADAFIGHRMKPTKGLRATRKHKGGAAPLDYTMRAGLYLAPSAVPVHGSLPYSSQMSGGAQPYGTYVDHINKGFWNPQDSITYDPVKGQQAWPVPYASTGSNLVGGKRNTKKQNGGNAPISQAFERPFPSSSPPSIGQDMQDMWHGAKVGASADQVYRHVPEVHATYKPPM
jgi:hypothetical protein